MTQPAPANTARSGRWIIAAIVGLCVLPIVLGLGLFWSGWQPGNSGKVSHGNLLQPVLPLSVATLTDRQGQALSAQILSDKWTLLLVLPAECGGPCQETAARRLAEMRNVQVALNKEMGRVRRLVVSLKPMETIEAVRATQPDLISAQAPAPWLASLAPPAAPQLYIVDPKSQAIIRYAPTDSADGVRRDMDRLLRYSWIG